MKSFVKSFSLLSIVIITVVIIALLSLGVWFYHAQERALQKKVEEDLLAIARLKVNQISTWRKDQLESAVSMQEHPFLIDSISKFMESPKDSIGRDIRIRLKNLAVRHHLADLLLVDLNGTELLGLEESSQQHSGFLIALKEALKSQKAVLTELHSDMPGTSPHISVVIPLFQHSRGTPAPFAALVLINDASQFLYPLIQFWPTPSKTAETLLVQRDGATSYS
jgi:two-component system, cell cycle sensor histidine kinase and response regulator CckA